MEMAYCPSCRSQYTDTLPFCPGCGGRENESEKYLATIQDGYTLVLLSEDLERERIPYRIDRSGPVSFRMTGSLQGGKLYVPERLHEKAKAMLKRFEYELSWDPSWEDLKPRIQPYKGNPEEDAKLEKSRSRKFIYIYLSVAIALPLVAVLVFFLAGLL
jgi:hypothetical protein